MIIIVMGIAGTGKSTIGNLLAKRMSLPFVEGDDYHSPENVDKMSQGIPLNDEDRAPWLQSLSVVLCEKEKQGGVVIACSALKEEYRQVLQQYLQEKPLWIYLEGSEETIRQRISNRSDHFMPEQLLHSQLAVLEVPIYAHRFSIEKEPERIVEEIMKTIYQ